MDQWIDIASKFGVPVLGLVGLAYFLVKHVWPFFKGQMEESQTQRKAEIQMFTETIRSRDVLAAESQREFIKALHEMTIEMRGLRDDVRNNHK